MSFATELFGSLVIRPDISQRATIGLALENPVLLDPGVWKEIEEDETLMAPGLVERRDSVLNDLRQTYNAVVNSARYPFERGPLEEIFGQFASGEITLDMAVQLSRDAAPRISLLYIRTMAFHHQQEVADDSRRWEEHVHFFRCAFAALDVVDAKIPDTDLLGMLLSVVEAWIVTVGIAIGEVPDGRLYREAIQRGEDLLKRLKGSPLEDRASVILYYLGVLNLDPYFANKSAQQYSLQFTQWQDRLMNYYGNALAGLKEEDIRVPAPALALATAIHYLELAAALRKETQRAYSLKALAEAYNWSYIISEEGANAPAGAVAVDPDLRKEWLRKALGAAREGLALFVPAEKFIGERNVLTNMVDYWAKEGVGVIGGVEPDADKVGREDADGDRVGSGDAGLDVMDRVGTASDDQGESKRADGIAAAQLLLDAPLDTLLEKDGFLGVLQQLRFVGMSVASARPDLALDLWKKEGELLAGRGEEQQLVTHFKLGFNRISRALADLRVRDDNSASVTPLINLIKEVGVKESWPPLKVAINLLIPAIRSTGSNEEPLGLVCLNEAIPVLSTASEMVAFIPLLHYLKGVLYFGVAYNLLKVGSDGGNDLEAAKNYGYSLVEYLRLPMPSKVLELLDIFQDLIQDGSPPVWEYIVVILVSRAIAVELAAGERARVVCQDLYRQLLQRLTGSGSLKPVVLIWLLQLAKGAAYSAMLQGRVRIRAPFDNYSSYLLQRISALTAQAGVIPEAGHAGVIDEEFLLSAYSGENEKKEGNTPAILLENIKNEFDGYLHETFLRAAPDNSFLLTNDQLQAALGPRTVWMSQYFGAAPDGHAAIYTVLVTREEIKMAIGYSEQLKSATLRMSEQGVVAAMPILGYLISGTRKELQEDPDGDNPYCSKKAEGLLREDGKMLLGGELPAYLADFLKKGKKHLCITPHGPLHFYPYHLLPLGDKLLSEDWIVTSMPNIKLLDPSIRVPDPSIREGGQEREAAICSMGISFLKSNPYRLPRLENAPEEAIHVAKLFGAKAITDDDVTEKAFRSALQESARVHIATHGLHQVSAPYFQCMFVNPASADGDDGIIHAYELLGMDLRGLDLVTLSACETALGRMDQGDNFRGLPSCLLLAGVRTLIGTLWEAETESCELFFGYFYERIKAGYPKLDAFQYAQAQTRVDHPEYRDWGAFYLMGEAD